VKINTTNVLFCELRRNKKNSIIISEVFLEHAVSDVFSAPNQFKRLRTLRSL
jgi:hypothetical protein